MLKENVSYKVKGYYNRWSVIDEFKGWVLLENESYGDETCYLLTRANQKANPKEYTKKSGDKVMIPTIIGKVYETYDDIETTLDTEGLR